MSFWHLFSTAKLLFFFELSTFRCKKIAKTTIFNTPLRPLQTLLPLCLLPCSTPPPSPHLCIPLAPPSVQRPSHLHPTSAFLVVASHARSVVDPAYLRLYSFFSLPYRFLPLLTPSYRFLPIFTDSRTLYRSYGEEGPSIGWQ